MKNKLGLRNPAGFFPNQIVKNKTLIERNEGIDQKEIRAVLHIFFDNSAPTFIYNRIYDSVSFWTCLHRAEVLPFNNTGVRIQKRLFAQVFHGRHHLAGERPKRI